jgi:hypothetical protein
VYLLVILKFTGVKCQRCAKASANTSGHFYGFHREIGAKEATKNPAGMEMISPFFS